MNRQDANRADYSATYADDAVVAQMTRLLVDAGHAILQSHRLGPTDRAHVRALLTLFDPPPAAHPRMTSAVLDIGSGVGAVAAHMAAIRPDLRFTLLNLSPAQLSMIKTTPACVSTLSVDNLDNLDNLDKVAADMHALPFSDCSFDAAMFNFSLGHGRLDAALAEARRVVRPGGIVFAYELTCEQPDAVLERLGYRPHRLDEIMSVARRNGVRATGVSCPQASTADAERLFGSAWTDRGFDQCWPIACRFVVNGS